LPPAPLVAGGIIFSAATPGRQSASIFFSRRPELASGEREPHFDDPQVMMSHP